MAEIISSNRDPDVGRLDIYYPVWKVAILGVFLGIIFWLLNSILHSFIFDSIKVSSDVSMVVTVTFGLVILMKMRIARPLMIMIAVGASLWSLAVWTDELSWSQIILWNIILFTTSSVLYSWLARFNKTTVAMLLMLFAIMVIRIIVVM